MVTLPKYLTYDTLSRMRYLIGRYLTLGTFDYLSTLLLQ